MVQVKSTLTGVQETLLLTVYCRAEDAKREKPILNDLHAVALVQGIDYDFSKMGVRRRNVPPTALRGLQLDQWTEEFITSHASEPVTVLHLACGLDTRAHRVLLQPRTRSAAAAAAAGHIRWIDLDLPEVVRLRSQLLAPPPTASNYDYSLLAGSATDLSFLDPVPNDRPTLVVFEGLSMYLEVEQALGLLSAIVGRFPKGGYVAFDAVGWLVLLMQRWSPFLRKTGAELRWAVDEPVLLMQICPGLRLKDDLLRIKWLETLETSFGVRLGVRVGLRIPMLRNAARLLRYQF